MTEPARIRRNYTVPEARTLQRTETHRRIRDAARELFFKHRYEFTSMKDIADAAGVRRSTVYIHYKDKAEIVAEIIQDYVPRVAAVFASFPGPRPSIEQVCRWMDDMSGFFEAEQVPISIIINASPFQQRWPALQDLTQAALSALGTHNAAFRVAAEKGGDLGLRAKAALLLMQLTLISPVGREQGGEEGGSARQASWNASLRLAVAEAFHDFVHRYGGDGG